MSGDKKQHATSMTSMNNKSNNSSPKSGKTTSSDSLTRVNSTKNIGVKNILLISISSLIFSMILSIIIGLLKKNIITFNFNNDYLPFQTNEVTLIIVILIKICN